MKRNRAKKRQKKRAKLEIWGKRKKANCRSRENFEKKYFILFCKSFGRSAGKVQCAPLKPNSTANRSEKAASVA